MTNATLKSVQILGIDCELIREEYQGGRLAVRIIATNTERNETNGHHPGTLVVTLSVNIPEVPFPDDQSFVVKNFVENEGLYEHCLKAGLLEDTGLRVSGLHTSDMPVARLVE